MSDEHTLTYWCPKCRRVWKAGPSRSVCFRCGRKGRLAKLRELRLVVENGGRRGFAYGGLSVLNEGTGAYQCTIWD